jgi:protein-disulfide isomerase
LSEITVPSRRAPRSRVWPLLALGAGGAVILAAIVILATGNGPEPVQITGVSQTQELLGGIRQDGNAIGSPDAPVTISIFDALACGAPTASGQFSSPCADYYLSTVPPLVDQYVRNDTARLQFHDFTFLGGADITTAGIAAAAAGQQDREWQFVNLLYLNLAQAGPNLTEEFLNAIAGGAGLDISRWQDAQGSPQARALAQSDSDLTRSLRLRANPAVVVDGPAGTRTLQDSPSVADIQAAVEAVQAPPE